MVAENAGIYLKPDSGVTEVFGSGLGSIKKFKEALGVGRNAKNVVTIIWRGKSHQVVIDPEDVSILTIFTNPETVKHRWQFGQTISTSTVHEELKKLLVSTGLEKNLVLLPPFPDGGIQIIRRGRVTGQPIDKSLLSEVVKVMFATAQELPIAMFGDGYNDIPAMNADGVIPITFQNGEEIVKAAVRKKNGYVSPLPAVTGLGVVDGLRWLGEARNFFGKDSKAVFQVLQNF
ncbi:MAG: hypothetical protein ACD_57C00061G0001 [uncultured bacterium]|nr:MAG: hypothetical protein ACD_57C00061G0001 [uncultured bacterium]